jgi:hypothetical protein
MTLHFYDHSSTGTVKECGNLEVVNPVYRSYPEWQPEALPATKRAGDVEATLDQFSTGHGGNMSYYPLKGGGTGVEFGTNREGGQNESGLVIRLRSLTDPNQEWRVDHVVLNDATGNSMASGNTTWSGGEVGAFGFSPGLWTNEEAWKLRCEIKRTKGFGPEELLTFKNVPLGAPGQTNSIGWSTNLNGVTVTLDYVVRRLPVTNNNWSSSQLSDAHFIVGGLAATNDQHFDLLETRTDDGTVVEMPSTSISGGSLNYGLRNLPLKARTLDFTFAVQQGRWLEFLVKPDTGSTRVERPAVAPGPP